ncbi:hydrogenase maturation nickel metallochaperone HypA/HybF [Thermodesulfitimonas sp.]
MHEVGLIYSLMDQVAENAAQHGITKIRCVKLVVGRLTLAQPAFLQFAFENLRPSTIFTEAHLEIEERPLVLRCTACGTETRPEYLTYFCPACGERMEIISGDELFIEYYEGDDGEDGSHG